jgi:hypothetical protein
MSNIIPFRARTVASPAAFVTAHHQAVAAVAGASRLDAARPLVRDDVRKTVLLLDLALQHARELSDLVTEERARRIFDRHLAAIEYSLQIARERLDPS